jgi:hypothetical protein
MKKEKLKDYLDFTPLIILTIYSVFLILTVLTTEVAFMDKHILGLLILPVCYLAFYWNHKIGVLFLAITLITGLLGLVSYSAVVSSLTIKVGKTEYNKVTIFEGQPIFLLWLLIHFIVSGRHYFGILTQSYWNDLLASLRKRKS